MMTNASKDIKKSQFVEGTEIPEGSTFDFVANGANKKISKANMINEFGVTGSIEQLGEVTGVPVLNKTGTINQIRNVTGGSGVVASLSPLNGIQLDHNFTANAAGIPVLTDETEESPVIRSLIAGPGIGVASENGAIQISATDIVAASNVVIINQMSDFPTPVSGVITLADDTGYLISANLTTTNSFILGSNTSVFSSSRFVASITYNGTGTLFTSVDASIHVKDITLEAANGSLFDCSTSISQDILLFENCTVESCDKIGTVGGFSILRLQSLTFRDIKTDGLTVTGTSGQLFSTGVLAFLNGGTLFDLDSATLDAFDCSHYFTIFAAGTFFLSGLVDSGNISSCGLGSVVNSRFCGLGTPLENITPDDDRWAFRGNDLIRDTKEYGLLSMASNTTQTVIAVATTPVLVAGTWVVEEESQFTGTTAGRLTYNGTKDFRSQFSASLTGGPVSGIRLDITFHLSKNGVDVAGSERTTVISSGDPVSTTIVWSVLFEPGDYIEVSVSNDSNTNNILISSACLMVN